MNYGKLVHSYCITATLGKAVEYYYFESEIEADRAKKKLIKEGYEVEQT